MELNSKVDKRFYTTTGAFAKDMGLKFAAAIVHESQNANALTPEDADKTSPSKKVNTEVRDRRKLGKRIIKAVQPMLEAALRAECDVNRKPAEEQLKNLNSLLESCLLPPEGSSGLQEALADLHGTKRLQEDEMLDTVKTNGIEPSGSSEHPEPFGEPGNDELPITDSKDVDVEMPDVDADHDIGDVIHVEAPVTEEVTLDTTVVQKSVKAPHADGITPPDTNGYSSAQENSQASPPTPPISTGDNTVEAADVLSSGGIPWYLKDFQPEGTSVLQDVTTDKANGSLASEELSDMDDDDLKALGDVEVGPTEQSSVTPATKSKKAKTRRKWRGFK